MLSHRIKKIQLIKKMKKNDFLTILFVSLFVVIIWITTDFIRSRPQEPLKPNLKQLTIPFNPIFNTETLTEIEELPSIPDINSANTLATPTPSSTPNPIALPTPTPQSNESTLNQINVATGSALF